MVPARFISSKKAHMDRRISISTPAVGSSRIRSWGSWTRARAIIRRRFIPPDRYRAWALRLSPEPEALEVFLRVHRPFPEGEAIETRLHFDNIPHLLEDGEMNS